MDLLEALRFRQWRRGEVAGVGWRGDRRRKTAVSSKAEMIGEEV